MILLIEHNPSPSAQLSLNHTQNGFYLKFPNYRGVIVIGVTLSTVEFEGVTEVSQPLILSHVFEFAVKHL